MKRHYTLTDRFIKHADHVLRTLVTKPRAARLSPAADLQIDHLNTTEQHESARLMRVNHTGEVCAQALYLGQSFTARNADLRDTFEQAADEEIDHLAWCEERIRELNGRTSRLNLLFYTGSCAIGMFAGFLGDRVSAAFLAETEYQVVEHLDRHLQRLPAQDRRSRDIVARMREDELKHATTAEQIGTTPLPESIKKLMRGASKIMTGLSYRV